MSIDKKELSTQNKRYLPYRKIEWQTLPVSFNLQLRSFITIFNSIRPSIFYKRHRRYTITRRLTLLSILFFIPLLAVEDPPSPPNPEPVADTPLEKEESPSEKKKGETTPTEAEATDEKEFLPSEEEDRVSYPVHQATESYEIAFIKTVVVLIALLVLVILTIWMVRKVSHGRLRGINAQKSVKILEKRPLSPKSILYLIEVGGKQVLIAESQLEVRPIATLDWLGNDRDL
ncbi:MAG: flagellar biosynthetic protein FliO [Chlamydiota bacterium]